MLGACEDALKVRSEGHFRSEVRALEGTSAVFAKGPTTDLGLKKRKRMQSCEQAESGLSCAPINEFGR